MNRRTVLFALTATALGARGAAQARTAAGSSAPPAMDHNAFERLVAKHMQRSDVPALTLGYAKAGQLWLSAFGKADVENAIPARADSAYRYASVQKTMTAAAALQLAERGKLDLDADVRRYVPYFPAKGRPITPRQLLQHTSGLPHYVNREAEQHIKEPKTTEQAVAIFAGFDLLSEPGTKFTYSSYGYNLLGAAIEGASGLPYAKYMKRNIWAPLGMAATRMDDPVELIPNRVRGYRLIDGKLANSEFIDVSSRFAAGGTRGTVPDLLRFQQGLFEGKLLSKASLDTMLRPTAVKSEDGLDRGMGCTLLRLPDGRAVVTNDGGQPETRTFIMSVPSDRIHIALAQNLEADNYGPLVMAMFEALVGQPIPVPKRG